MIFLCHKCGGNLTKHVEPLYDCGCISGWVRDWQEPVTLENAVKGQIEASTRRRLLYIEQERSKEWIEKCDEKIAYLTNFQVCSESSKEVG
jgi:hypothetical protein